MKKHKMKKQFGQNFLTDKNLLRKIIDKSEIKNKKVIEIGPGQGALTQFLVLQAEEVTAYEIDLTLKTYLDVLEEQHSNLKIKYEDILKVELPKKGEYHVVANIPYNITSPILFKILESKSIKSATLMVQKEVCDRITSKSGVKDYNALTVIVQYYMKVEKLMDVKRHLFRPVPKVDSAVFKMTRRDDSELLNEKEELFISMVKAAFMQKRKTLANNWVNFYRLDKSDINEYLLQNDVDPMVRAEDVEVSKFIELAKNWPFNM